jgi:hypothetical protein
MKIGFTGTQQGMTPAQEKTFKDLIKRLNPTEFHHGDCVGADLHAHYLIKYLFPFVKIKIHPPLDSSKRAFAEGHSKYIPKPYLERNKAIVNMTNSLIATPKTKDEQLRSGTWSTIRYAKSSNKKVYIINPDGSIQ